MKKYLPFVIKYLPDVLIQVGLYFLILNSNLATSIGLDDEGKFFLLALFLGVNILLRRYFNGR